MSQHSGSEKSSVTVFHLIWIPFGIAVFKDFLNSYKDKLAGFEHYLVLLFNGVQNESETLQYHHLIKSMSINYSHYSFSNGQDIDIYIKATAKVSSEYVLFFNSYSVILADNWLYNYIKAFSIEKTALVGASASNMSYYSATFQKHTTQWEGNKGIINNLRKYKLFMKALIYWRFLFKPFPNPHLRSNAFMLRRTDFLDLCKKPIDTKFIAYQFESGRQSMTNHFLKEGLNVLVLDKHGNVYGPPDWEKSSTFWINEQENLLVSDNQTRLYQEADSETRRSMAKLAWGVS